MIRINHIRVVDPVTNTDKVADIVIDGAHIKAVGENIPAEEYERVIDGSGLTAAPGLMDAHVHFRDPGLTYKEDIFTGAQAAAAGGFTTVVLMANTKPPVDNPETLKYVQERAAQTGIRILQASTVTRGMQGKELVDMEAMKAAGAPGFTDDGVPIMDEKILKEAMEKAAALDMPIALHEEDPLFVYGAGVNKGKVSEKLGYGGAAAAAEDVMTARDCMIALETGADVCIQHISSKNSVEMVRLAKSQGAHVWAEATPHHFTLTEDAVLTYGNNCRMNPPVRTEEDRLAIIEGLKDKTIDMIVTDHAPHAAEEKAKPLPQAPSGIIGLETSLALGIKSLVQPGHLTLMELIERMSTAPARLYRLKPDTICAGAPANLVLFGEDEMWKAAHFYSKASNSPFVGWDLPGRIHMTISDGKIVFEN